MYNAYLKLEEELVQKAAEELEGENQIDEFEALVAEMAGVTINAAEQNDKLDLHLWKLETLIERRAFLLSDTILRQNPHNVYEWLNRVTLCNEDEYLVQNTFEKAIATVDPEKAYGKPEELFIQYGLFYKSRDIKRANEIFNRGTRTKMKNLEQTANLWCSWAEMLIVEGMFQAAYVVVKHGCSQKKSKISVSKSPRMWALYADLEEQLGTVETVKAVYDEMIESKLASPTTFINYFEFLERNQRHEDKFKVMEKAAFLLTWPHLYDIWILYINSFIDRFKGSKVERTRELLEQVVKECPKEKVKIFYYIYSDFEEKHGLLSHAIKVLDRALKKCAAGEKKEIYSVLIAKAACFFGITKSRTIFERSLEDLESDAVVEMGLKFANVETKLGEIDRARAVYVYIAEFSNPSIHSEEINFWSPWEKFELENGTEVTYKEMLRLKRKVAAKFSMNIPVYMQEDK